MAPLVSIITPAYYDNYLQECIRSVLNQTFDDWEMLIIDDGSKGRIPAIVSSFEDDRIRYFRQEHVGVWGLYKTYNRGLRVARGKYIAILEGDDFWPPYKLEKQVPTLEERDVVLSYGKVITVTSKSEKMGLLVKEDLTKDVYQNRPVGKILEKLLLKDFISSQTVMCRKDSLVQIGGFKQPPRIPSVDYPTWLELSLIGEFFATNEILGYWRRHKAQATQVMSPVETEMALIEFRERFFHRVPPEIKEKLSLKIEAIRVGNWKSLGFAHLREGRIHLLNEEWSEARRDFRVAMGMGSPLTNLGGLAGFGISYFRRNLEPFIKAMGLSAMR